MAPDPLHVLREDLGAYNALVQSWPEITRLAREGARPQGEQATLFSGKEG